jgi:carbon storage regulator
LRLRAFFVPIPSEEQESGDDPRESFIQGGENMLVLTRKSGESIRIGENIELTILSVKGSRVRIGINCPNEVPIRRGELKELSTASEFHDFAACNELELQLA